MGLGLVTVDVAARLADPDLGRRAAALGLRDEDRADLLTAVDRVLGREADLAVVARLADQVIRTIGDVGLDWDRRSSQVRWADGADAGILAVLAFLVTAPEAAAFHARRGVAPDVSAATLADLGQQVHVHRLTDGAFGLHTPEWVTLVWSGFLYALGRLQFNLALERPEAEPEWVLSTHIPRTGPLTPAAVDASFAAATGFFAERFPDFSTGRFHCGSWLLDPALSEGLPGSNLAAFQQRWNRYGDADPGTADVLLFVFSQRGPVDPATLPTDTALRRLVVERLTSGAGWGTWRGWFPQ